MVVLMIIGLAPLAFGGTGGFAYDGLHGAEQDVSVTSFHARRTVGRTISDQVFGKAKQEFAPEIRVGDLATAELNDRFYAIAFLQKANRVVLFEVVVMIVGIGTEFQFLYLNHMLFSFLLRETSS